jgi:hypothetical protein
MTLLAGLARQIQNFQKKSVSHVHVRYTLCTSATLRTSHCIHYTISFFILLLQRHYYHLPLPLLLLRLLLLATLITIKQTQKANTP